MIVYLARQKSAGQTKDQVVPTVEQHEIHRPAPRLEPDLGLATSDQPQYAQRDYVISYQERNFYELVQKVLSEEYGVFAQVRMADIVRLTNDPKDKGKYTNYILTRHIDFVICDMRLKAPKALIGIELDDPSHKYQDRSESDEFKNSVFKQVGLPLLRFKVNRYTKSEVEFQIHQALQEIEGRNNAVDPLTEKKAP